MFGLFARGAKSECNFSPVSKFHSSLHHITTDYMSNTAAAMGSVITIDNFATKMSSFNPNHAENHLYGLVDMGRYSPMPACFRILRSDTLK
jgi:hypothetical protein